MLLKNADIMNRDFETEQADIAVEGDVISAIGQGIPADGEVFSLEGCLIVPGFVDIHIHGCAGADTCDATREALSKMARHLAGIGVTSFCPTTMTLSGEQIKAALRNIKSCMDHPPEGAAILGANMEGPYISPEKKGGQNGNYVCLPNPDRFMDFWEACGGIIKLIDIAPERDGADAFIQRISKLCTVSIAHTEASYEEATTAFQNGITHVTHLFNAMPGLNHRAPGTVGAVFDHASVMAELICDGFHIHPAVLRMAFRLLGEDRALLVSDSMRAAGLPDGAYDLGGQQVIVKDAKARLADGTIAGSTTNIHDELKNLVRFGIPLRQAVKAATINPARAIGEAARIGSIQVGKAADFVVLDRDLNIVMTIAKGRIIKAQ